MILNIYLRHQNHFIYGLVMSNKFRIFNKVLPPQLWEKQLQAPITTWPPVLWSIGRTMKRHNGGEGM